MGSSQRMHSQGGVTRIHTVGRSEAVVKLKSQRLRSLLSFRS